MLYIDVLKYNIKIKKISFKSCRKLHYKQERMNWAKKQMSCVGQKAYYFIQWLGKVKEFRWCWCGEHAFAWCRNLGVFFSWQAEGRWACNGLDIFGFNSLISLDFLVIWLHKKVSRDAEPWDAVSRDAEHLFSYCDILWITNDFLNKVMSQSIYHMLHNCGFHRFSF